MKLPANTVIARRKMTDYLLRPRLEIDKSGFLALAGYTSEHAGRLLNDLRDQLLPATGAVKFVNSRSYEA
jgi:hypothetical protein